MTELPSKIDHHESFSSYPVVKLRQTRTVLHGADQSREYQVVDDQNSIVGTATLYFKNTQDMTVTMELLIIDAEKQGQKLGAAALLALIRLAGARPVASGSITHRAIAHFWEKLTEAGFARQIEKNRYVTNFDAIYD